MKTDIDGYIEQLIFLEERLGYKTSYKILEPFNINCLDIMELQKAAKKIASFIGMENYTFLITITSLEQNIGGQIELDNSETVFIELSRDILQFNDTTIATLVHEITHKYLYINGIIKFGDTSIKNEIFTDIASVFLGFGKILLNGCKKSKDVERITSMFSVTEKINKTLQVGYLNREQLALVYLLICNIRRIPSSKYYENLCGDSIEIIKKYEKEYKSLLHEYFQKNNTKDLLIKNISDEVRAYEFKLEEIYKEYILIKNTIVDEIETVIEEQMNMVIKNKKDIEELFNKQEYDPFLIYLNNLKLKERVTDKSIELDNNYKKLNEINRKIKKIKKIL